MKQTEHVNESAKIESLLNELNKKQKFPFPKAGNKLCVPIDQGVYIIRNPKDEVAHVGRTVGGAKGLFQRLNNHMHGASSFVIQHLKGDGSKLRNGWTYQLLIVKEPRSRALLEHLATAKHCPKHLGLSKKIKD